MRSPRPLVRSLRAAPYDVAVVGGGPAGCAAATLLGAWGRSVVLIARDVSALPPLAESLPPSTFKTIEGAALRAAFESEDFLRTTGNTSWWESDKTRVERFGDDAKGWQVLRSRLEEELRRTAVASGAVLRVGSARSVTRSDGVLIVRVGSSGASVDEDVARVALDASGRAGLVAGPFRAEGVPTLALSRAFRDSDRPSDDAATHTLVEAYEDGWAWSVPLGHGERHLTVMIDPPAPGIRPRDVDFLFERELRKTRHLYRIASGGAALGRAWAADATPYVVDRFAQDGVLFVGDAASFIDPLSSFGVKKALFSGWLAAVAVNTVLADPEREKLALDHVAAQERSVHARYVAEAARFATQAALRFEASVFWARRAAHATVAVDEAGPTSAAIAEAHAWIRSQDALRLRLGDGTAIGMASLVEGREIVAAEAVVRGSERVHFVDGVRAATLVRHAARHRSVATVYDGYCREAAPVEIGRFVRALATVVAAGLVRPVDES